MFLFPLENRPTRNIRFTLVYRRLASKSSICLAVCLLLHNVTILSMTAFVNLICVVQHGVIKFFLSLHMLKSYNLVFILDDANAYDDDDDDNIIIVVVCEV